MVHRLPVASRILETRQFSDVRVLGMYYKSSECVTHFDGAPALPAGLCTGLATPDTPAGALAERCTSLERGSPLQLSLCVRVRMCTSLDDHEIVSHSAPAQGRVTVSDLRIHQDDAGEDFEPGVMGDCVNLS